MTGPGTLDQVDSGLRDVSPDALWLFDGVCHLCSGSVRLILLLDRDGVIRFTPIQSDYGRELALAHGIDPDQPQSFIFFDHGRALTRSDAAIALLERLPRPWRWLAVVSLISSGVRDVGYDWLARNRYRLLGRRSTCFLPSPEDRARFLDSPPTP